MRPFRFEAIPEVAWDDFSEYPDAENAEVDWPLGDIEHAHGVGGLLLEE